MAVAITAPVAPTPASGEVDVPLFAEVSQGQALPDVVGTTTTSGGNVKVEITSPEGPYVSVVFAATLLAFTSAGKLSYVPNTGGKHTITVTDVTSGDKSSTTVLVQLSEGV